MEPSRTWCGFLTIFFPYHRQHSSSRHVRTSIGGPVSSSTTAIFAKIYGASMSVVQSLPSLNEFFGHGPSLALLGNSSVRKNKDFPCWAKTSTSTPSRPSSSRTISSRAGCSSSSSATPRTPSGPLILRAATATGLSRCRYRGSSSCCPRARWVHSSRVNSILVVSGSTRP